MSWLKAMREKEPSEPANPIGTIVIGTLHPDMIEELWSGKCCGGLLLSMKEVSATCYVLTSESLKEMFPKFPKPLSG